jgi:hypothetical protein
MKTFFAGLFTVFTTLFLLWSGIRIYNDIHFNINCGGYLHRAAYANTIELAAPALQTAIQYVEANGLTNGYTSVIYRTPGEDVGFWYSNLKQAENELNKLDKNSTTLEKSNTLMKLRESLVSQTGEGASLICPEGISVYPYNTALFWMGWLSALMMTLTGIGLIITSEALY